MFLNTVYASLATFFFFTACQSSAQPFRAFATNTTSRLAEVCKSEKGFDINWEGAPVNTESFLVIAEALGKSENKVFWSAYNIPAQSTSLSAQKTEKDVWQFGRNDFAKTAYSAPCANGQDVQSVLITVYALSAKMPAFFAPPTAKDLRVAADKSILGKAQITYR